MYSKALLYFAFTSLAAALPEPSKRDAPYASAASGEMCAPASPTVSPTVVASSLSSAPMVTNAAVPIVANVTTSTTSASFSIYSPSPSVAAIASFVNTILQIAPNSYYCYPDAASKQQCATADQAALPILNSFEMYNLTTNSEKAAVLSTMAFESVQFKFNRPVNRNPGQGTRAMMDKMNNALYALSIPSISDAVRSVIGNVSVTATPLANGTANAVRNFLTSDPNLDFGAGAWYLATQCNDTVRAAVKTQQEKGWEMYLSGCVKVDPSATGRRSYYEAAVKAFGGY